MIAEPYLLELELSIGHGSSIYRSLGMTMVWSSRRDVQLQSPGERTGFFLVGRGMEIAARMAATSWPHVPTAQAVVPCARARLVWPSHENVMSALPMKPRIRRNAGCRYHWRCLVWMRERDEMPMYLSRCRGMAPSRCRLQKSTAVVRGRDLQASRILAERGLPDCGRRMQK